MARALSLLARALSLLLLCRPLASSVAQPPAAASSRNLHTVFTSECNNAQFDWFTVGVYESFRQSGMQGSITRLLACDDEGLRRYKGLDLGPTFVHPNYRHNPRNNDTSASYNKPASVMHFVSEANFTEEYILFIDADMLLTKPIDPAALGAKKGVVVSEYVPYMIGSSNEMAANFLPAERVKLAKQVGWYHIFHRDDLARIAPLWLEYCGRVRTEPEKYWAINGSIPKSIPTGDAYVEFGKAPWISEMYGYSFGAAMAGVEHVVTRGVVKYPSEMNNAHDPSILHYGIDFTIGPGYNWNKMSYQKLDLFACTGRYFGPPPALPEGRTVEKRLVAMRYVVNTLNKAFCSFYHARCSAGSAAADAPCPLTERPAKTPKCPKTDPDCCADEEENCWAWALDEQCGSNPGFMRAKCKLSCGVCKPSARSAGAAAQAAAGADARLGRIGAALQEHVGGHTEAAHTEAAGSGSPKLDHRSGGHEPSSAGAHGKGVAPSNTGAKKAYAHSGNGVAPSASKLAGPAGGPAHPATPTGRAPQASHEASHAAALTASMLKAKLEKRRSGDKAADAAAGAVDAVEHRRLTASLQEEMARVASQHRDHYAPGNVPRWLEKEAAGSAAHDVAGMSGGAAGGGHAPGASAAAEAEDGVHAPGLAPDGVHAPSSLVGRIHSRSLAVRASYAESSRSTRCKVLGAVAFLMLVLGYGAAQMGACPGAKPKKPLRRWPGQHADRDHVMNLKQC